MNWLQRRTPNAPFDVNRALTFVGIKNAEFYLIGKKSGGTSGYWSNPKDLSIEDGRVDDAGDLASLKGINELEIWTKTRTTLWARDRIRNHPSRAGAREADQRVRPRGWLDA